MILAIRVGQAAEVPMHIADLGNDVHTEEIWI